MDWNEFDELKGRQESRQAGRQEGRREGIRMMLMMMTTKLDHTAHNQYTHTHTLAQHCPRQSPCSHRHACDFGDGHPHV